MLYFCHFLSHFFASLRHCIISQNLFILNEIKSSYHSLFARDYFPKIYLHFASNRFQMFTLVLLTCLSGQARAQDLSFPIEILGHPISAFETSQPKRSQFGPFEFLGGLDLGSSNPHFGGLSGIAINGNILYAISDTGYWLRATLKTNDKGAPIALTNAEMAPLIGIKGSPISRSYARDAEALVLRGDGSTLEAWVAFERMHKIYHYALGLNGLSAHAKRLSVPQAFKNLQNNGGIEALTLLEDGKTFVAFSEKSLTNKGMGQAFRFNDQYKASFSLQQHNGFHPTDAVTLPNGNVLLLERRFTLFSGMAMRLRLLQQSELQAEAIAKGTVLLQAGEGFAVDNMEGITLNKDGDHHTIITLISDNNHTILQRSLLLRFRVANDDLYASLGAVKDNTIR